MNKDNNTKELGNNANNLLVADGWNKYNVIV